MAQAIYAAPLVKGRDYRWWVGQDNNVWANIEGIGVKNLGQASGVHQNRAYNQGLDDSKYIADPNPGNRQATNAAADAYNYASGGSSSRGSSSGSSSTYDAEEEARKANMRSLYDRQIDDINSNLGTMDRNLDNSLASVRGEYDQYKNEQESNYKSNKNDYDKSTLQNLQDLQSNRNNITDRASSGLRGLLRVLGAMGAGGGSVARYEAPSMVTAQANQEYNNAGKTYSQNQSSLDTDWGNYQNQYENDKKNIKK